jgi:hypothetical protein
MEEIVPVVKRQSAGAVPKVSSSDQEMGRMEQTEY